MIAAWLAGKVSGIIIFCVACLSVVLLPAVIIQTVRINGISVFGWYAVDGYKPMLAAEKAKATILESNQITLKSAVTACNSSIDLYAQAGKRMEAAAKQYADAAKALEDQLKTNIAAIRSIKSTDEKCPTADVILRAGLR